MSEIPWKPGETCRTRDGREARVYAVDGGGKFPIHGAVLLLDGWIALAWQLDGRYSYDEETARLDLMPPKRVMWVNRYLGHVGGPFGSREAADFNANPGRTECIRVEYEPGQFDE